MSSNLLDLLEKVKHIDLYELLEVSDDASKEVITKAYRKRALKFHPDKNPDDPKAAETFLLLSQGVELLTRDIPTKAAYDRFRKAKIAAEERNRQLDSKRRKLKEDLEAREGKSSKFGSVSSAEVDRSLSQLEKEILRLRKEGSRWVEAEQERLAQELRQQSVGTPPRATRAAHNPGYALKAKWIVSKSDGTNAGITQEFLTTLFSQYGPLNLVVMSQRKPGSAVIDFKTKGSAEKALQQENGRMFELSWTEKEADNVKLHTPEQSSLKREKVPVGLSTAPNPVSHEDFEAMVLAKMNAAAAAKRKLTSNP